MGGRPPEPYYGREIGIFSDFAHGIRVKLIKCKIFKKYNENNFAGHSLCR